MKSTIALALLLTSISSFAAKPKNLCPQGSDEIVSCVAKALLPLYPFVSACQGSQGDYFLVLDGGPMTSKEAADVDYSETDQDEVFTTIDQNFDHLKLTFKKQVTRGPNGVLSYYTNTRKQYDCKRP